MMKNYVHFRSPPIHFQLHVDQPKTLNLEFVMFGFELFPRQYMLHHPWIFQPSLRVNDYSGNVITKSL